jgi:3-deoxy-manno-octulosonate cytidylyltransferase (CMP-KDO synthetase)
MSNRRPVATMTIGEPGAERRLSTWAPVRLLKAIESVDMNRDPDQPLSSVVVIPARLASTRLPGKLLLRKTGLPLIQHTYEACRNAKRPGAVLVAADCEEIVSVVRGFGGRAELTSPYCSCGTERVAEIAHKLADFQVYVNVQGDEPEISGAAIDTAIADLENDETAVMSTLAAPIRQRERLVDPSCVKLVLNGGGRAIYFSRAPIPFAREWSDSLLATNPPTYYQHIGVYAYRRDFLIRLSMLPRPTIEGVESLEQLRVLHAGCSIAVSVIDEATRGIDTPNDYECSVNRERIRRHAMVASARELAKKARGA